MKFLSLIAAAIISLLPGQTAAPTLLGSAVPSTPALVDTYLAANIDNTQDSMQLANGNMRSGQALSGFMCFTLDANTPTVEYVCGTASGTAVSSMTRGIDVMNPNATSSAMAYTHRRFANVQTTDYPTIQFLVRKANGTDSYPNLLSYESVITPTIDTQIVDKYYVDHQIAAGAPVATESVPGISILGSKAQTYAGTATGTYGSVDYSLIPQNKYFNGTSSATNIVPVTRPNGKLSQGFLDLTDPFTFSGGVTSTGQTNLGNVTITGTAIGNGFSKFGGTGADGALSISSGTTTLDIATSTVLVKNYTSISITGTSSLSFINPHASGTLVILRSLGACTLTSSNSYGIDLRGIGSGSATATTGTQSLMIVDDLLTHGGSNATKTVVGASGTQYLNRNLYTYSTSNSIYRNMVVLSPGSGGGGSPSAGGGSVGVPGGRGGGALLMECGGNINFTGNIDASGQVGSSTIIAGYDVGGGGGGAGGQVVILYNGTAVATSGTINTAGGSGGNGTGNGLTSSDISVGAGGAGSLYGAGGTGGGGDQNGFAARGLSAGGGGAGGSNGAAKTGGAGGSSAGGIIIKNTEF